jgi:acetyltransferase-like isoleucine patch superfamily enzyme
MLNSLVNSLIRELKHDPTYQLDPALSDIDLVGILWRRAVGALRGLWYRLRFRHVGGVLFVGRGVIIRHGKHIFVGRNLTMEDGVEIDALSREGVQMGDNVTLGTHVLIRVTGTMRNLGVGVRIGDDTGIGAYCYLGAAGGIMIGNHVSMGQRVNLHAENHNFRAADLLIAEQGVTRQGIIIEDDCWIGSGSIILDGVTVHKGAIIGAGSVVTRSVDPYTVVAGAPARVISHRG